MITEFMKERLWLALVGLVVALALAVGLLPSQAHAVTVTGPWSGPEARVHVVGRTPVVDGLRLRTRPGGSVKGLLYRGDALAKARVIRAGDSWAKVRVYHHKSASGLRAGTTGWVWKGYLKRVDFYHRR
ncbi:SH3 domain-containing protein [Streptomyces sp. GMY02]|uniref:SH3 domain-containing protein n=1 Tax=Streptomyces sp. GMY02 TaxID=1333528 RepID=UPI001C2BDEF4|nr:SH3 domain-containing protein [Streptomyces sp. GMY02]QXE33999.1 SH3 domain-containing protein [Streptomyces sp. GMY02]